MKCGSIPHPGDLGATNASVHGAATVDVDFRKDGLRGSRATHCYRAFVMATYWKKLKDPRWQKMRLQVLERDNWQCQYCGETSETLHVHHGHYKSKADPWEYDEKSLHTVCERCHDHADCIRVDLQYEIAQLPLHAQESLIHFVCWLNSMGTADINYMLQNNMPHQEDMEAIDAAMSR